MKRNDRFFSRSRKKDAPVTEETPAVGQAPAVEETAPVAETVVVGRALLFEGAPEPMPIMDEQLFLSAPPQGGLVISPECVGTPLLVIWKNGEDWLVRRLCQERFLYNGFETMGDSPILLQDGVRLELVGVSAFTFLELREPAVKEPPVAEETAAMPAFVWEPAPMEEPERVEAPAPEAARVPVPMEEPVPEEEPPFDWTPFLLMDDDEFMPQAEPVPAEEPVPAQEPELPAEAPEVMEAPIPEDRPETAEGSVPVEEPPFDWAPFLPAEDEAILPQAEPEIAEEPVPVEEPEVAEAPVPVEEPEAAAEPIPEEAPPFDWTPFLPSDDEELLPQAEPEIPEEPVPVQEPEVTEEPVPVEGPEAVEETAPVEAAVLPEPATPREALVLALEQLASGDREVLQTLPGLLEQVDLYCWGGFDLLGIYIQPIPAVRPVDWSGDADTLDQLGWEPRPGMVIPVFTCEEEAVKRNCPLGAFPSCSAPGLFARFAEMGLDLELDPFGERPVWVPAGAVRALSEALGGGAEKIRWIRRTLPW